MGGSGYDTNTMPLCPITGRIGYDTNTMPLCPTTGRIGYDTTQYISFVNPDKSVVVVGLNAGEGVQHLTVSVDGAVVVANATLPPHSFNTFRVPASHMQQHVQQEEGPHTGYLHAA